MKKIQIISVLFILLLMSGCWNFNKKTSNNSDINDVYKMDLLSSQIAFDDFYTSHLYYPENINELIKEGLIKNNDNLTKINYYRTDDKHGYCLYPKKTEKKNGIGNGCDSNKYKPLPETSCNISIEFEEKSERKLEEIKTLIETLKKDKNVKKITKYTCQKNEITNCAPRIFLQISHGIDIPYPKGDEMADKFKQFLKNLEKNENIGKIDIYYLYPYSKQGQFSAVIYSNNYDAFYADDIKDTITEIESEVKNFLKQLADDYDFIDQPGGYSLDVIIPSLSYNLKIKMPGAENLLNKLKDEWGIDRIRTIDDCIHPDKWENLSPGGLMPMIGSSAETEEKHRRQKQYDEKQKKLKTEATIDAEQYDKINKIFQELTMHHQTYGFYPLDSYAGYGWSSYGYGLEIKYSVTDDGEKACLSIDLKGANAKKYEENDDGINPDLYEKGDGCNVTNYDITSNKKICNGKIRRTNILPEEEKAILDKLKSNKKITTVEIEKCPNETTKICSPYYSIRMQFDLFSSPKLQENKDKIITELNNIVKTINQRSYIKEPGEIINSDRVLKIHFIIADKYLDAENFNKISEDLNSYFRGFIAETDKKYTTNGAIRDSGSEIVQSTPDFIITFPSFELKNINQLLKNNNEKYYSEINYCK